MMYGGWPSFICLARRHGGGHHPLSTQREEEEGCHAERKIRIHSSTYLVPEPTTDWLCPKITDGNNNNNNNNERVIGHRLSFAGGRHTIYIMCVYRKL